MFLPLEHLPPSVCLFCYCTYSAWWPVQIQRLDSFYDIILHRQSNMEPTWRPVHFLEVWTQDMKLPTDDSTGPNVSHDKHTESVRKRLSMKDLEYTPSFHCLVDQQNILHSPGDAYPGDAYPCWHGNMATYSIYCRWDATVLWRTWPS